MDEAMKVSIHLYTQSLPVVEDNVKNAYQKGDFYCVMIKDTKTVHKFPMQHIFRVIEDNS
jgi:hypothetical protein